MKPAKPLTCTHKTPTRKTWGKGLTGTGTGWPGIPLGYPWYSLTQSNLSAGTTSELNTGIYQDVLVECNAIVEGYRKGEIPKASAYVEIQSRLVGALGDDRARTNAAFGSFIATIESHDAEVGAAVEKRMGLS